MILRGVADVHHDAAVTGAVVLCSILPAVPETEECGIRCCIRCGVISIVLTSHGMSDLVCIVDSANQARDAVKCVGVPIAKTGVDPSYTASLISKARSRRH